MNYQSDLPTYIPLVIAWLWWWREVIGVLRRIYLYIRNKNEVQSKIFSVEVILPCILIIGCLLLAETYCAFILDKSDSLNFSFVSRLWFSRHWKPINQEGFRSREQNMANVDDKKVVLVLGDSFAAGHGIENYKDTFPEILAQKMGDSHFVVNYSKCGWDTKEELNAALSFPLKPDIVILSYLCNDILSSARDAGLTFDWSYILPQNKLWAWAVNNSYFMNYIHFNMALRMEGNSIYTEFIEFLLKSHRDPLISEKHIEELRAIAEYAETNNSQLIVIQWPIFSLPNESSQMTANIDSAFEHIIHKKIDLLDRMKDWPLEKTIVSFMDPHPSISAHAYVADLLAEEITGSLLK